MHACSFSHAYERSMRIFVVTVPPVASRFKAMIAEAVVYKFNGSRGIGHEYQVEVLWIGIEKLQRFSSCRFDFGIGKL